ncbi:MAG TPA: hypothetical protein VN428_08955 [Bryobacteraceae bacterium]|nr:hypothetical protein [Bryobacteraceae bacterium]
MRLLYCLLAVGCLAFGQFSGLAVTDDAAQVYFSTPLRLKYEVGSAPYPRTNAIYRILGNHIEPFSTPPGASTSYLSIAHVKPRVSGSGDVIAYTIAARCSGGSSCLSYPSYDVSRVFVHGTAYGGERAGVAQISVNGRYVVTGQQFIDLETGATLDVPAAPANDRQVVTSDGRVLLRNGTAGLQLWSPAGGSRTLPVSRVPAYAILNDTAFWVIYQTSPQPGEAELWSFEIGTGREALLARQEGIDQLFDFRPTISNNADWVLYAASPTEGAPRQAFLIRPDGGENRQLTRFWEGVSDAVLAGFGTAAFVSTPYGRLARIDVMTGAVTELLGRTPVYYAAFEALIPGSVLPLRGTGLSETTQWALFPLPSSLADVRVFVNGRPMPILSVSPGEVWFQVPFDLPIGGPVRVELGNNSVFANGSGNLPVVSRKPYFFSSAGAALIVAHQDFSGPVTRESPARPGEVVHAYAVGLGAVSPALPTGVPAPLDTLHHLAAPFDCTAGVPANGSATPVEVLFAGLAPGFVGLYQVDIRVPATATDSGDFFLSCGTPGNILERHGGAVSVRSE